MSFELARELRRRGRPAPRHLVASGFRAPHRPPRLSPISGEPQARFLDVVQERYGAFAEEILREPELVQLIVPTLRADLALIERYRCTNEMPLDCPITVFGGTSDHTVGDAELDDWRLHTTAGFDRATIPGGHFFVKDSRADVLAALQRRLPAGASLDPAAQQP